MQQTSECMTSCSTSPIAPLLLSHQYFINKYSRHVVPIGKEILWSSSHGEAGGRCRSPVDLRNKNLGEN